jgi:PadR family transcriptional regulator, regulatory protein PadR
MPRRVVGVYLPIEYEILEVGIKLQTAESRFYGFALARQLAAGSGASALIGHGTLYKALSRMVDLGLLTTEWEDADIAAAVNRPRRRFYEVSGEGERVLANRPDASPAPARTARTALA